MMTIIYCPRGCGEYAMLLPTDLLANGRHNVCKGCLKVRPDVSFRKEIEWTGPLMEMNLRPDGVDINKVRHWRLVIEAYPTDDEIA